MWNNIPVICGMESIVTQRMPTDKYASFNGFERARLGNEISSLGFGFIAIPSLKELTLEEDEAARRIRHALFNVCVPAIPCVLL